jgi:hypothetical protein
MKRTPNTKAMPARKDTDSREFFRDHLRDGESAASTLIVFHQRYDGGGDTGGITMKIFMRCMWCKADAACT